MYRSEINTLKKCVELVINTKTQKIIDSTNGVKARAYNDRFQTSSI